MTEELPAKLFDLIGPIFHEWGGSRAAALRESRAKFAHYTLAATAQGILSGRELWMRKPRNMNDYSEVVHGKECLAQALGGSGEGSFLSVLNGCVGSKQKIEVDELKLGIDSLLSDAAIACFSEHHSDDVAFGRLSMWRAYASANGAALVFNPEPFFSGLHQRQIFVLPVFYADCQDVEWMLKGITERLSSSKAEFEGCSRGVALAIACSSLAMIAVSTKHSAFKEEKEWRVVHLPLPGIPSIMTDHTQVISNVPQLIRRFHLKSGWPLQTNDFSIAATLERVLIGPSDDAESIRESIAKTLKDSHNIDDPDLVRITGVPLRC